MNVDELLTRGVAEVIVESELRAKLASGRKLRFKQGFDPSKPEMHIGHAVGLRKLRQFQDLGHEVVLIVGDWTAQIGDPSGKDESRPRLDAATVADNARSYMDQFFRIVDRERTEVRWQSEWFGTFTLESTFNLVGRFTLAQMLAHETFRKRYDTGSPITMLELDVPDAAGLRLRCDQSRCGVRRHGPEVQYSGGSRTDGGPGDGAAAGAAGAVDSRHRRQPQDGQVAGQYDRHNSTAGGNVRQADVAERQRDAAVLRGADQCA